MKQKKGRKLLGVLLALVMIIGLMPGMSLTAYAETSNTGIEVLITDIDCEHYKDKTTSFTTDDGLANISFSATPKFDENHGWYNPNGNLTIKVTAANEDYPISKCMFQCDRPGREDSTAPFEVTISYDGNWNNTTATINGVSESSGGLKHIGIFSRITPDYTALSDGMLINLGEKIIPNEYYYRTTGGLVDTDDPENRADFKQNDLYILVRGNIERRQVDPSYDPDWYKDVFVESNNGDHYAFLQVAEKRYIFDGAWTITNHADGLLVTEDTSQNMMFDPVTTYSFSVHEKVFNDVTVDSTIENGSIEIKDSKGTAIIEAEAGSTVTLDVSADEGYKLKEISANYLEVQSVSELMELMGDTKYYADPNDIEYSDYYMATKDGIKCFGFSDDVRAFLSKTAELDKSKSAEGVYTASGKYENDTDITWKFTVKKGKIIVIAPVIKGKEYPAKIESTGKIAEPTYASVGLTPVTTGEQYTFTMLATDVTVHATFASKEASVVTKAPEAKTLTYSGQAQELVTGAVTEDGTVYYAIGENDQTAPDFDGTSDNIDKKWTTSIPTATDAGTYYVWYKVVGDANHNDTTPVCVTVEVIDRESAIKELEDLIDEYADTPLAEKIATIALRAERKIDKASKQKDISDILQNAKDAVLDAVKQSAKSEIEQYDPNDYLDNDKVGDTDKSSKQTVEAAKAAALANEGEKAIDAATDKAGVQAALDAFNAAIANCKLTKAAEEEAAAALATAKTTAKADLAGYKDPADYRDAQKKELKTEITAGKQAINEATSIEDVESILATAKAEINKIKTDAQLTKEESDARKAAEAKAKKVKNVTVNVAAVTPAAIDAAVKKAGGKKQYVTTITLGKNVKKINARAFVNYKAAKTLVVNTKKLKKKRVKKSLTGSQVTTIKVKVGTKKKVNKKYTKKYKKIFKKKNSGKKVKVVRMK